MKFDELLTSFAKFTIDPVVFGYRPQGALFPSVCWVNPSFLNAFGYDAGELEGKPVVQFLSNAHRDEMAAALLGDMSEKDQLVHEGMFIRKDRSEFWGRISVSRMPEDPSGGRYSVAVINDLSALKERERIAEDAVRENRRLLENAESVRARLLMAIDSIGAPLAIWDRDWKLVECNEAFSPRLLGQKDRLPEGTALKDFLERAAYSGQFVDAIGREEEFVDEMHAALLSGTLDSITRYLDGQIYRTTSTSAPNGDTIMLQSDITAMTAQKRELENKNIQLELARAEADMRAFRDDLTSLGNRRYVGEALREMLAERLERGGDVAALALDLDRFKQINDTLGHAAGDFVLQGVAKRLRRVSEKDDLIGRVGGDEFILLRRVQAGSPDPMELGQRIVEAMTRPFHYEDNELRVGASVGIAQTPLSSEEELLTNADVALYKAKSSGRGQVISFDEQDLAEMTQFKKLSDEIFEAIEKDEFVPYLQPQLDVATNRIVGLEALARWDHPVRGILAPIEFIDVATDIGALEEIDRIVFEKSLEFCQQAFPESGAPDISFNVGADRLLSQDVIAAVQSASSYSGAIAVELLESIIFEDQSDAFNVQLDTLREVGARIEVDDFGSGRASIIALEQVSPDRLKIDKRLVAGVAISERSDKLVRAIVDIGQALGIGITAEGVETVEQAARLKQLGCDRLQGYLFGAAMSRTEVLQYFRTNGGFHKVG